uniref:Cathepsin propeptide inhibitor domain-containing protein n=1 Tax=Quercus lobata TaxID=97700 RepID=A0A7N2LI39_QUELO
MGSQEFQLAILFLIWASPTCLSFSLPSEYSILGQEQDKFPTEERVIELFQQWMKEHKRVYKHAEEAEKRFENFKRNLKYITKNNEEFKKTYLSNVKKPFNKMSNTLLSGKSSPYGLKGTEQPFEISDKSIMVEP